MNKIIIWYPLLKSKYLNIKIPFIKSDASIPRLMFAKIKVNKKYIVTKKDRKNSKGTGIIFPIFTSGLIKKIIIRRGSRLPKKK